MPGESVEQILDLMTKTFTSGEKNKLIEQVQKASESAEKKFAKYFCESDKQFSIEGESPRCHPARLFLKEIQYFHPVKSLLMPEMSKLTNNPDFELFPDIKKRRYRGLARGYQLPTDGQGILAKQQLASNIFWARLISGLVAFELNFQIRDLSFRTRGKTSFRRLRTWDPEI